MKKRSIKAMTAGLVGLSLIAASCGSDDSSSSSAPAGSDAPAGSETPDTNVSAPVATDQTIDDTTDTVVPGSDVASTDSAPGSAATDCETSDEVSLQLQWFTQAQFAGYYAALDQGYYDDMCLDVTIVEGGVEIVPQTQLANGDVDFALAWVPKALASREAGADIVDIAQIYERSGTLQVSFADSGIESPADFKGKTIGNWGFGNEYEVFAAIGEAGLDPASDVTLVGQNFDMIALLEGEIDAAEAMTYNEYAQVLEAENPDTGELYTPEDFTVINYEDEGVGMLQDAIWASGERLKNDPEYKDQATRFVAASMQGWAYCRDNIESCRDIIVDSGSTLGDSHQLWQVNEVNKLIWPSSDGIGYINPAAWDRTVEISKGTPNLEGATVLTEAPSADAYTNEIVEAAWALLEDSDVDLFGPDYEATEITLKAGGS